MPIETPDDVSPTKPIPPDGDYAGAIFRYFDWKPLHDTERPYEVLFDIDEKVGVPRCNFSFVRASVPETVHSIRGQEANFELDVHGFAIRKHSTKFSDWFDRTALQTQYIPEMEKWLLSQLPDATRVVAYDWRYRDSASVFPRVIDLKDPREALKPAQQAHVDCSLDGTRTLLKLHHPHEAESLMKNRFRIINVWRPLRKVENWPLAMCDSRTVAPEDVVVGDRVRRDYVGEGIWLRERHDKDWYYLPNQGSDEVILIKISDSKVNVGAKFCVHASFDFGEEFASLSRESMEIRMFVFSGQPSLQAEDLWSPPSFPTESFNTLGAMM